MKDQSTAISLDTALKRIVRAMIAPTEENNCSNIVFVAPRIEMAKFAMADFEKLLQEVPSWLIGPVVKKQSMMVEFSNGARVRFMSKQNSMRGVHITHLFVYLDGTPWTTDDSMNFFLALRPWANNESKQNSFFWVTE